MTQQDILDLLNISSDLETPIYHQIANAIRDNISLGKIKKGDKLPSINQVAGTYKISKETVVKGVKLLQEQDIVEAVHGKGFFIANDQLDQTLKVMLFLDAMSAYKEKTYYEIINGLEGKAQVDTYLHHFNIKVFEQIITNHLHDYNAFIIIGFDDPKVKEILTQIPNDKLYLIDRIPQDYKKPIKGIVQDFETDVFSILSENEALVRKYEKFTLVFRNTITVPPTNLVDGFKKFCDQYQIPNEILTKPLKRPIEAKEGFLVVDDEDLVTVVAHARINNLTLGKDIGVISYNDTSLKREVAQGISVISVDFGYMGKRVVEMLLNNTNNQEILPAKFHHRNSF